MAIFQYGLVLLCVLAIAVGQLFFKLTANSTVNAGEGFSITGLIQNPWFLLSLAIYGGATLLWIWILQRVPLTAAYPLFSFSFIFVPLLGMVFLGEQVAPIYWIGIVLIMLGVGLTALSTG